MFWRRDEKIFLKVFRELDCYICYPGGKEEIASSCSSNSVQGTVVHLTPTVGEGTGISPLSEWLNCWPWHMCKHSRLFSVGKRLAWDLLGLCSPYWAHMTSPTQCFWEQEEAKWHVYFACLQCFVHYCHLWALNLYAPLVQSKSFQIIGDFGSAEEVPPCILLSHLPPPCFPLLKAFGNGS